MKQRIFLAFVSGLIVLLFACTEELVSRRQFPYDPDSGAVYRNSRGEFEIINADQLMWIAYKLNNNQTNEFPNDQNTVIKLMNDIDLTGKNFDGIATSDNAIFFNGTFDGGGFTIENMTINRSNDNYVGFIGKTYTTAVVKNLRFKNANVTGKDYVGILVGDNNGIIERCGTGGGTADAISNRGSLTGMDFIGAIAGANSGIIRECYNTASVTEQNASSAGSKTGGIVGNNSRTVENSYNLGRITYLPLGVPGAGIAGQNSGTVNNCYSPTGTGISGGLVGSGIAQNSVANESSFNEITLRSIGWDFTNVWQVRTTVGTTVITTVGLKHVR